MRRYLFVDSHMHPGTTQVEGAETSGRPECRVTVGFRTDSEKGWLDETADRQKGVPRRKNPAKPARRGELEPAGW